MKRQTSLSSFFKNPNESSASSRPSAQNIQTNENESSMLAEETESQLSDVSQLAVLSDEENDGNESGTGGDSTSENEPSPKKLKGKTQKNNMNRVYTFKAEWRRKFSWLRIVSIEKKTVYCALCKDEKVGGDWAREKKLPKWRSFAFQYHETSDKRHLKAIDTESSRPKKLLELAAATAKDKANDGVIVLMKNVLFTVQKNLPIYLAENIHQLVDHLCQESNEESFKKLVPTHHRSNFSSYTFIDALNKSVFQSFVALINNCVSFNLHLDESTDLVEQKHLMLYMTMWNQQDQSVKSKYVELFNMF